MFEGNCIQTMVDYGGPGGFLLRLEHDVDDERWDVFKGETKVGAVRFRANESAEVDRSGGISTEDGGFTDDELVKLAGTAHSGVMALWGAAVGEQAPQAA